MFLVPINISILCFSTSQILRYEIRVLTEADFTERRKDGKTWASSMFWEEEERCGRHLLQMWSWIDQDQWSPDRVGWTRDPPLQSLRTHHLVGKAPFRRRGHAHLCQRRRSHRSDLRHQVEYCKGFGCLLPEVCWWTEKEGDQGYSGKVW